MDSLKLIYEKSSKVNVMKKIAVIIICLISCLMLSGVAYASWSLGADVNVNAGTADLDIKIVEANALYSSPSVDFRNNDLIIGDSGKTVSINLNGIYPGSVSTFEIIIKNSGTMPIRFDEIIQQFNDVIDLSTGENLGQSSSLLKTINIGYKAELLDKDYSILDDLSNVTSSGTSDTEHIFAKNLLNQIEPGQYVRIIVDVSMVKTAGNETMNKRFDFTISPLFVQN